MGKKKMNMMTDYEQDCMWMSYRYCIGRHTISSVMHAHDIAVNCYKRMSDEQSEFTAMDIRKEIANILRITTLSFKDNVSDDEIRPYEHFVECINRKTRSELLWYKKIVYNGDGKYTTMKLDDPFSKYLMIDVSDLREWANLASLFDIKNHKFAELVDGTTCEYFDGYIDNTKYTEDDVIYSFEKVKIPIEEYLKTSVIVYIPEDNILKTYTKTE